MSEEATASSSSARSAEQAVAIQDSVPMQDEINKNSAALSDPIQSESSRVMSQAIHSSIIAKSKTEAYDAKCALRKAYLKIFEEATSQKPLWWKQQLILAGENVLQKMLHVEVPKNEPVSQSSAIASAAAASSSSEVSSQALTEPYDMDSSENATSSEDYLSVWCNGKSYSYPSQRMIAVGMEIGCDILITGKLYRPMPRTAGVVSRVHAIIFQFKELNKVYIVDVGSQSGIKLIERGPSLEKRDPINPFAFSLHSKETACFQLGPIELTVNPRTCLICMNSPRTRQFVTCHHYVACDNCVLRLTKCPLCRTVGPVQEAMAANTVIVMR
jgi:hypothetical protein